MAATLKCDTLQNASSATANITLDTAGNATVGGTLAMGSSFLRNRIINGDMRIDQRNAGASLTPSTSVQAYAVDRFSLGVSQNSKCTIQQNAGAVTPPAGFSKYYGFTSTSAYSIGATDYFGIQQRIEGLNFADLAFGGASAKSFTVSFWVYSTGLTYPATMGVAFQNGGQTRSYAATYSITSSGTWQYVTITVPGDTTGTWATDNTAGLIVTWSMGVGSTYSISATGAWQATTSPNGFGVSGIQSVVGTNGATFYITGVQLEAGSTATPFERRQYGTELMLCQRYFCKSYATGTAIGSAVGAGSNGLVTPTFTSGGAGFGSVTYPVTMRATPTVTIYDGAGTANKVSYYDGAWKNGGTAGSLLNNGPSIFTLNYSSIASTVYQGFDYAATIEL